MAARLLIAQGHRVVLHARNAQRALDAMACAPGADSALLGDLSRLDEMRSVAQQANALDPFDAVIHNTAVGYREPKRIVTPDGLPHVFAINTLAPYVLTALMHRPKKIRVGEAPHARHPFPAVLGMDLAGVVESVGPGVEAFRAGDEV